MGKEDVKSIKEIFNKPREDGNESMNTKKKQIFEVLSVLILIFLVTVLFVMSLSYVSSSNMFILFKMAFELSPFILMVFIVSLACKIRKIPLSLGLGFEKKEIPKQLLIGIGISLITIFLVIIMPLLFGANKTDVLSLKARSLGILIYYIIKMMYL